MRRSPLTVVAWLGACGFTATGAPAPAGDAARAFDPATCPSGYVAIGSLSSRYRSGLVANTAIVAWTAAQARCADDRGSGGTTAHLVVFETASERKAVWDVIGPSYNFLWTWTGVYATSAGWQSILGDLVAPSWADGDPQARTGAGQHAIAVGATRGEYGDLDLPIDWNEQIICECDGRAAIASP